MSEFKDDASVDYGYYTADEKYLQDTSKSIKCEIFRFLIQFSLRYKAEHILEKINKVDYKGGLNAYNAKTAGQFELSKDESIQRHLDFLNLSLLFTTPEFIRELISNSPRKKNGTLIEGEVRYIALDGASEEEHFYGLRATNMGDKHIKLDIDEMLVFDVSKENKLSNYENTPTCRELLDKYKDLSKGLLPVYKKALPIIEAFCVEDLVKKCETNERIVLKIPNGTKRIPSYAFSYKFYEYKAYNYSKVLKQINEVVIPEGVEEIGEEAFRDCTSISRVALPNTLKKIEAKAFSGCYDLKIIPLPDSLTEIGRRAFDEVRINIEIPKSVYIGDYAFREFANDKPQECKKDGIYLKGNVLFRALNDSPEKVLVPEGTVSVSDYAFIGKGCDVTLPDSVIHIGVRALEGVKNIHHLPKSLRYIGPGALEKCESLGDLEPIFKKQPYHSQPIYIENGEVVDMGYHVTNGLLYRGNTLVGCVEKQPECMTVEPGTVEVDFHDNYYCHCCDNVKKVVFPSSVKSIKHFSLYSAGSVLEEIEFCEGLEIIETGCFNYCHLKEVYIPDSVKYIGQNSFWPYLSGENPVKLYVSKNTVLLDRRKLKIIERD